MCHVKMKIKQRGVQRKVVNSEQNITCDIINETDICKMLRNEQDTFKENIVVCHKSWEGLFVIKSVTFHSGGGYEIDNLQAFDSLGEKVKLPFKAY